MTSVTCAWCGAPSELKHCSHRCKTAQYRAAGESPEANARRLARGREYKRQKRATALPAAVVTGRGEEWRQVLGYEGLYEVSNLGRVQSLDRVTVARNGVTMTFRGRELTPIQHNRYLVVELNVAGKGRQRKLHQLVCEAFHGPRPAPEYHVRHLNGNALDNRVGNLRWGTASENVRDSVIHGTQWQVRKTHCPQGHEYNEANTRYSRPETKTGRQCRICTLKQQRDSRRGRAA